MPNLAVEIVRFVDDHQPGWVECGFIDAEGRRHTIIEKVPIVSPDTLDSTSEYPQSGFVRCEVLHRWEDDKGQKLARISTLKPLDIESTLGLSEFVVLFSQLRVGDT